MDLSPRKKNLGHILELGFLLALVLPPLVQGVASLLGTGDAGDGFPAGILSPRPATILLQGTMAAALLARSRSLSLLDGVPVPKDVTDGQAGWQKKGWRGWLVDNKAGGRGRIAATLLATALLFASSILWNWLAQLGGVPELVLGEEGDIRLKKLVLLVAYTAVAALYEEVLYRWYAPALLGRLLGRPLFRFLWLELVLLAAFALAHGYGGWPAVGNALVAGAILRSCILLTASPLPGFLAHLAYNLVQLALLMG